VKLLNLIYKFDKKIIIKEEHLKWHLEAFASELFICFYKKRCFAPLKCVVLSFLFFNFLKILNFLKIMSQKQILNGSKPGFFL